jgi:DNA-binding GntR family transcriptional regulator
LCEHFKVSRTPIRAALGLLEERKFLEHVPHRGYFTLDKAGNGAEVTLPLPAADELYLTIAEERIGGQLPVQVSEADLTRRYGVSKGNLTRALQRLLREGLVERRPGRGWMFTPILDSKETHDESYRFRLAIEPQALLENGFELDQEAAHACEAKHRQILDGTIRDVSAIELFEMNAEFHELLARSSGNRFFLQAIQQQNRLRRFVNYHWTYGADRVIATCREHMAILEAIQNGDRTWAANLLRRHIEISGSINPYEGALDGDQKPQHVISLPQARR